MVRASRRLIFSKFTGANSAIVMAFGFYQLACMLLAIYEPTSRFAVRSSRQVLPETDVSRFTRCPCYQVSR